MSNGGAGSFFRKHSRLITFVGALIVFTMFLVKEGKQAALKDTLGSFDHARDVFSAKKDNSFIRSRLASLQHDSNAIKSRLERGTKPYDYDAFVSEQDDTYLTDAKRTLIGTAYSLNYIDTLVKSLPDGSTSSLVQELQKLSAEQKELFERSEGGGSAILENTIEHKKGAPNTTEFLAQDISDESRFHESKVVDLGESVVDATEPYRRDLQHSYDQYSYAAYALYTLGWGLGLLGRLYGGGDVTE